ncbi:MAG: hypothetical protein AAGM45_23180, partial [Cyanobacteria bacterium J06588_5]
VPVEANVSGTPVISYGAGGVLDTQVPRETGVFFSRQSPESLYQALLESLTIDWDYSKIREHVLNNFTEDIFFKKATSIIDDFYQSHLEATDSSCECDDACSDEVNAIFNKGADIC